MEASEIVCACCHEARGFIYVGPVYSENDLEGLLCPWCIHDGSAAAKFEASFSDPHKLADAGVSEAVVEEVTYRTPGYVSWQGDLWLAHCGDACEFHGDASADDVRNASVETKRQWMQEYQQGEEDWRWVWEDYTPGSDSALYKFRCRHCGLTLFGWDLS